MMSIVCYKINMKKRSKVIITSLSLAVLLGVYYNIDYNYNPSYKIIGQMNSIKPFATYSKGNVYILKKKNQIKRLNLQEDDIVIIDERDGDNPNMQVISSYTVTDKNVRNEIILIMQEYNTKYPSNWNRTNESLRLEWYVHNLLYNLNYKHDHTTDVDFDNNDEEEFNKPFFNHLLKI